MGEWLTMSVREAGRLGVIQAAASRQIRQAQAAVQLGLSVRQVKRLVRSYRERGAAGLVSARRGKRPPNAIAEAVRERALALVGERCSDFGPTLAREKLTQCHGFSFRAETLRHWMRAAGLWAGRRRRRAQPHPRRPRRWHLGELVQIDGSRHDWSEERGPQCVLVAFIDDATSRLLALRFAPAETTQAYMETPRDCLRRHGRPVELYSDRYGIFRVNRLDREGEHTQFTRALHSLEIRPIHACGPQAKGRVERAFRTLQGRLVKELRLRGICDIEGANAYLPEFVRAYNERFAVQPQSARDAHRRVWHSESELDRVLCLHHRWLLSKHLSIRFGNREYRLLGQGKGYRLRGAVVTVCESFDGGVTLLYRGRELPYRLRQEGEPPTPVRDGNELAYPRSQARKRLAVRPRHKLAPDHPWRSGYRAPPGASPSP